MQIAATQEKTRELEEQVRQQPMSSMEARKLKQRVKDDRETVAKLRAMVEECNQRVSELQMQHNQSVFAIDKKCREVNDKLRKLATIVPDAASLPTMDYDTSKRADPVVLNQLVAQTKTIKVRSTPYSVHNHLSSDLLVIYWTVLWVCLLIYGDLFL